MAFIDGMSLIYPKQRLSYAEKIKDDNHWGKKMIDLLLLNSNADQGFSNKDEQTRYHRMLSNYQIYNNILNQTDFEQECNPLGLEEGQLKDEIKPYNKIPNKINVLLGEEYKRPFNFKTVLVNSEGIKSKQEAKKQLLKQFVDNYVMSIMQQFIPNIGQPDPQTGEIIKPENLEHYMKYTYQDSRERLANQILQYLIKKDRLIDKKNDSFKHGLLSGEEHVWVDIENGEPTVIPVNSLGMFYHKSAETKFIEDRLYAGYRTRMNTGDIIDRYGEYLSEKDLHKIERTLNGVSGMDAQISRDMKYYTDDTSDYYLRNAIMHNSSIEGSYGRPRAEDWIVCHVEWRSQKKIGFLTRPNQYGEEDTIIVSEDFKVPSYATKTVTKGEKGKSVVKFYFDDMSLEWAWIPEIWEGVRIGQDIYCCIGPKKYQYRSIDNPHKVKLGYHGVVYSNMNAEAISLVERMKPFQYLYFIIAHKLKRLIARDKGQTFHFDLSMVPEQIGLEKTIYYLEEMDIDFYNPLQNAESPGVYQRSKVTGSTSRSNMQFIISYVELLRAIDEQINDVAGISAQREGQTSPNQAVTNAQQDIIMSSTVTEATYFKPHDMLWENILNSLIQCAQVAWKDKSVIKQYVLDDMSIETLEVPSDSLVNSDIAVFVSNSSKDSELFGELRALAQPLLQNDKAKFSDIIKLLKSTSIRELEMEIKQSEEEMQKAQLEQIRAQQEAQKQAQEQMIALKQMDADIASRLQAQKDEAAERRELIKSLSWAQDNDVNDNNIPDVFEVEKFREELKLKREELKIQKEENAKDREHEAKLAKIKSIKSSSGSKK